MQEISILKSFAGSEIFAAAGASWPVSIKYSLAYGRESVLPFSTFN